MPMISPKTINQCPRCFQVIARGSNIESFGRGLRGEPLYCHVGCKPASAAEKAVLVGATSQDKDELNAILAGMQQEVAHRPTATRPQSSMDGEQYTPPGGHSAPPPDALVKNGVGGSGGQPGGQGSGQSGGGGGGQQGGGMTADQLKQIVAQVAAQIKNQIGDSAAKFATEALDKKMSGIAAAAVQALMPKFEAKVGVQTQAQIDKAVEEMTAEAVKELQGNLNKLKSESDKIVQEQLKKIEEVKTITHTVVRPDKTVIEFPAGEVFHKAFDEVLKLAGAGFNVFLPGPTGCGKTHLAKQVAHALGLRFGLVSGSAGTTEAEFFGTALPNITTGENVFQTTDFLDLFENGGLFLVDEADALDPNCFLKINAALANGYCAVPKRYGNTRAIRHENFICIAAANTWGQGATRMYCGRNKLDEATLDRFRAATVEVDYDPGVEKKYACPDVKLYNVMTGWRKAINENQFQRVLSTRFMRDAYILHTALGYTVPDIAKKLTGGWTKKEVLKVIGSDVHAVA